MDLARQKSQFYYYITLIIYSYHRYALNANMRHQEIRIRLSKFVHIVPY